jgi:hypothetical protein
VNCQELRERLVDPVSAAQGGHTAMLEHLDGCGACRDASHVYGAIARLYTPASAGTAPDDFDARVVSRIAEGRRRPPAETPPPSKAVLAAAGGGLALVLVLLGILTHRTPRPAEAPAPTRTAAVRPPKADVVEAPPPILAVGNAPIDLNAPALSDAERAKVSAMYDADFLFFVDALQGLDLFYPEDVPIGPSPPSNEAGRAAVRPKESRDALELRLLSWRSLPVAERQRATKLDAEYRKLPGDRRDVLERRWAYLWWFPSEEKVGLRRIASRLAELDPARLVQETGRIRAVAVEPVELRGELWHALPFTHSLTGQEQTAGERLLIAR